MIVGRGGAICDLRVAVERAVPSSVSTTRPVACCPVVT
jgi:hypothetical protein